MEFLFRSEFLSFCLCNEVLRITVCVCVCESCEEVFFFFFGEHNSEMRSEYSLRLTLIIPPTFFKPTRSGDSKKITDLPHILKKKNPSTEVPASLAVVGPETQPQVRLFRLFSL